MKEDLEIKGTQAWEFFGLRYWNLYFFVVSYAEMLRFRLKKILLDHYWGRKDCSAYTETTQNEKKILSQVKIFFIFQVSNVPFIFANNSFSNIWSITSYSDGFISQNVKHYLAYTEHKQNQV